MKILHVITDLKEGGAQKLLFKLISNKNPDYKHTIVSLISVGHYEEKLKALNVNYHYLNMNNKRINFFKVIKLFFILLNEKPDVVQTWMYHCDLIGGVLSKLLGIKNILWGVVSFNLDSNVMKFTSRIIIKVNSILSYFIPNKIIYCAKSAELVHEAVGYDNKKSLSIPIGFENTELILDSKKKSLNNSFTLGCIARWDPQKDHKNLFDALRILDIKNIDYKCKLIGIGIEDENLSLKEVMNISQVDQNKIELLGFIKNIDDVFNTIDLNILSSVGEAFPNVIGEAMSKGIICIGTDVGDVKSIISDTGWVVPKNNSIELAEAIINARIEFMNKNQWKLKSINAQKRIRSNYPIKLMIEKYYEAWSKI